MLRIALALWVVACLVGGAYMLSAHLLTLPAPEITDLGLQRSAAAQRQPFQRGRWFVVHILDQDCVCSLRVLDTCSRIRGRPAWPSGSS